MRPKLLVLASTYPRWLGDHEPGFVHELNKRLALEFDITVLCPHALGAKSIEVMDGVKVVRYRYAPQRLETLVYDGGIVGNLREFPAKALLIAPFILCQLFALMRIVKSWRPDVIHAHWLIPQGFLVALSRVLGVNTPFIVTSHGADLFALKHPLFQKLKQFTVKKSSALTVVSNAMLKEVHNSGLIASDLTVEPMGVDLLNRFVPVSGIPRRSNEILFVGRLVEKKGLRYLVRALPKILSTHPDAFITVVGFGPEESKLRQQVAELCLQDRVRFVGAVKQTELPDYYRKAAVFVAPFVQAKGGDQEGLGLVLVEALGCGCQVVVSSLSAVKDVTECSSAVIEVPPANSDELAVAVSAALHKCAIDGGKQSIPGVEKSLFDRFDWTAVSSRYAQKLHAVINQPEELI